MTPSGRILSPTHCGPCWEQKKKSAKREPRDTLVTHESRIHADYLREMFNLFAFPTDRQSCVCIYVFKNIWIIILFCRKERDNRDSHDNKYTFETVAKISSSGKKLMLVLTISFLMMNKLVANDDHVSSSVIVRTDKHAVRVLTAHIKTR